MENKNSTDDLKSLRNYALGVAGFATTISAILIQAFHFKPEPTILCVAGFAGLMLIIVFLIGRAEKRQQLMLKSHIDESNVITDGFCKRFDNIDGVLLDIQRSTLRTEMCNEMDRHPENHDTILKMAERYFGKKKDGGLEADWYMSSKFLDWASEEQVKLPKSLNGIERD